MVISKSKSSNKKEMKSSEQSVISQSIVSSGEIKSSVHGGSIKTSVTDQLPMMQEKMVQKSSSSSVMKSSSSSKVSSSSTQEQKFFTTSASTSSSSQAFKSGRTQQLASQTDDFLRGERILTDIDAKRSKNGSIIIESVDLQGSSSSAAAESNLKNLVSVEIESKDSYAQHKSSSTNEFYTTTHSSFNSSSHSADQNRNDVIVVESGKSNGKNSTAAVSSTNSDQRNETSLIQGPNVTSSATFEEFSSSSTATSSTNNNNETKGVFSKNMSSSKSVKGPDGKNVADSTTTFTSKVYDDKTKSWVVVEQSSVSETDIILPGANTTAQSTAIQSASSSDNKNTMTFDNNLHTKTATVGHISSEIDSSNMRIDSATNNMTIDSSSTNNRVAHSDSKMTTKSSKEIHEKNMSSKKQSSKNEKFVSTTSNETVQVFDSKSNTWINIDAKSFETQRRPSYMRYRSQDSEGKWHTIYKRKLYDEFSKQWRIVDEKHVSSDDTSKLQDIPEMIDNAANITTTTYTTKVYDTKTGKWTIVDEKSYVDSDSVNVTQDIKREIEKDQPDVANIITTTETTKVSGIYL